MTLLYSDTFDSGTTFFTAQTYNGTSDDGRYTVKQQPSVTRATYSNTHTLNGHRSLRLLTNAGDTFEDSNYNRTDIQIQNGDGDCTEGDTLWYRLGVYMPSDEGGFHGGWFSLLSDVHGDGSLGAQQGYLHLDLLDTDESTDFQLRCYGGNMASGNPPNQVRYSIETTYSPDTWYEFIWKVKWTAQTDGTRDLWMLKGSETYARHIIAVTGVETLFWSGSRSNIENGYWKPCVNYHAINGSNSNLVYFNYPNMGTTKADVTSTLLEDVDWPPAGGAAVHMGNYRRRR